MKRYSPMQIEFWTRKINPLTNQNYTNEEATYKIRTFRKVNIEYWIERGCTKAEAILKVQQTQQENSKKFQIKRQIHPEKYQDCLTNQTKYWMNKGYTEEESKLKVKQRQTVFSLETCIQKYGYEDGLIKWQERQEKWQNTLKNKSVSDIQTINEKKSLSIEQFLLRYQQDGIEEYFNFRVKHGANAFCLRQALDICKKRYNHFELLNEIYYSLLRPKNRYLRVSRESLTYFLLLYKTLRRCGLEREDMYWGIRGSSEYRLIGERKYYYDFTILPYKLIIEYNGVRYHPSPRLTPDQWQKWHEPHHNRTADEKQKRDHEKITVAKAQGFDIITIWSDVSFEDNIQLINEKLQKWNIQL